MLPKIEKIVQMTRPGQKCKAIVPIFEQRLFSITTWVFLLKWSILLAKENLDFFMKV